MGVDTFKVKDSIFKIFPENGNNLFSWTFKGEEIFYYPENFVEERQKFYNGGNPILFPSVGRTWLIEEDKRTLGKYKIYGEEKLYNMPLHGFVDLGEWEKVEETEEDDLVKVKYKFFYNNLKNEYYPFSVDFFIEYILNEKKLTIISEIINNSDKIVPFAYGLHPYFYFRKDNNNIEVVLNCRKEIILDDEMKIGVGEKDFNEKKIPIISGKYYERAFKEIETNTAEIINRSTGRSVQIVYDENVEILVLYSVEDKDFVCLEPWTRGLGGFGSLSIKNYEQGNKLIFLKPGESKKIEISYIIKP